MLLKAVVNSSPMQTVIKTMVSSVMDAYNLAEKSSGASWVTLTAPEKLMRLVRELDIVSMRFSCM